MECGCKEDRSPSRIASRSVESTPPPRMLLPRTLQIGVRNGRGALMDRAAAAGPLRLFTSYPL